MWPRTVEVMLGLWLAASPFTFRHPADEPALWWNDFGCALLVVTISLLSFWSRTAHANLLNIPVALWLIGFGYFGSGDSPAPAAQNNLILGLVLLIMLILPSQATQPPEQWRNRAV